MANRSPASTLLCSPPTPSFPSAAAPVFPRQRPSSGASAFPSPNSPCTRRRTTRRRSITGSPCHRFLPRRNKGLPGSWAVLFVRAVVEDPAESDIPSPRDGDADIAFGQSNALGTRKHKYFGAAWPTAHTFACLRIAGGVATPVARLATDPGGLTPDRAGFAPAGRLTKFHEVIAYSNPPRPAFPGRTKLPIHYYGGAWIFPIKMKLALASVLFVLLVTGVGAGYRDPVRAMRMVPIRPTD